MRALFVPLAIVLSLIPDLAEAKYNVCSATLNSSDEIDTFKKTMGSKNFNYIELTTLPEAENEESGEWLDRACAAKIQCDILIVSGHFGGSFFGASGLNLSMESMEQAACKPGCDGIFKKPKEVYLMGCNTLAGKDGDTRTPEQYRAVLIQDGFDNETADQIVAFRYSAMGSSYADRMRGVFSGVPRIYGFDSIAPAGKNVKDLLSKYFKEAEKTGYYSQGGFLTAGNSVNKGIQQALKVTNFAQAEGLKPDEHYTSAACFLGNPDVTGAAKLKWIEEALTGPEMLAHLPYITKYFDGQTDPETGNKLDWTDKTFEPFENTAKFAKAKAVLHDLVMKPLDSIISVQAKAVEFQDFMGWLKPQERQELLAHLFLGDAKTKWTRERVDAVRSAIPEGYRFEFGLDRIPNRFDDPYFLEALISVKPKDPAVLKAIVSEIATSGNIGDILNLTGPAGNSPEAERYLASLVASEVPVSRYVLQFGRFTDPEAVAKVQSAMLSYWKKNGDSEHFWYFVDQAGNFSKMPEGVPEILRGLSEKYTNQQAPLLPHTCSRLYTLMQRGVVQPAQIEKWVGLLPNCDGGEARSLVSLVLNRSDLSPKLAEDFALAALSLPNPLHKDRGITDDISKALHRVPGPFARFDPAFRDYYAKAESSVTGPDTVYLKRLKYLLLDHLGSSPKESLALVDDLLAQPNRDDYLASFVQSSADPAAREKAFRAMWEASGGKSNQDEFFFQALIGMPSLIPEFMPKLLERGVSSTVVYSLGYGDAGKLRLAESFRSAQVLGPYLAALKKLDPKSMNARRGRELLRGIRPRDAAAMESLRAALGDADPELADLLRAVLVEAGDEPTKKAFLSSLEGNECGVPQEVYLSSLARFFKEPLTEIAKKEINEGINEQAALTYLIQQAGADKPEAIQYLEQYVQLMLQKRTEGSGDWLSPEMIMGLHRLADGKHEALFREALAAYESGGGGTDQNRATYRAALIGAVAEGLPADPKVRQLFREALDATHTDMGISALFSMTGRNNSSLSPDLRKAMLEKLGKETDPGTAVALLDFFRPADLSFAEKIEITKAVRQAPEAARQRWFEDSGHR